MRLALAALVFSTASHVALAQSGGRRSVGMTSQSSRGTAQSIQVSMPIINLNGELCGHLEKNLGGHATLALELSSKRSFEEIPEERQQLTGESRMSKGRGVSVMIARYGDASRMAGFYWGLGIGAREEQVSWQVRPNTRDPAYKTLLRDDSGLVSHEATLKGSTGHGRIGYRYVGESAPFVVGAYLGFRQLQASVNDTSTSSSVSKSPEEPSFAALSAREKDKLKRVYATRPETGIEVGYSF